MQRVVIAVEGGVVQTVCADGPVDVLIIDYDTEGVPDRDIGTSPGGDRCVFFRPVVLESRHETDECYRTYREWREE